MFGSYSWSTTGLKKGSLMFLTFCVPIVCDQVFPSISDLCFCEIAKGAMMQMLSFGEAIAISRRSPDKLFKILEMYETLRGLIPEVDSIFCGSSGTSVRSEVSGLLMCLGEAAHGTFAEFENVIEQDGSKTPVPGGAVHPLTRYVMIYIKKLCDYKVTLNHLFGENNEAPKLLGNSNGAPVAHGDDEQDGKEELSPLAKQINRLTHVLRNNLEGKSKLYKDVALSHLFLMNNVHYTVQKVKTSEVWALIGDDWVRKHTSLMRKYATSYQRAAWSKVMGLLRDEGIHSAGGGPNEVSRVVLKDRFKNFNLAFDEVHKTQSTWVVVDPELREELRISISDKLLPAYSAFVGRYGQFVETGRHPEKYMKYQPEDLEVALGDFFEGSSNSMTLRRKPAPHQ
jgi:exocyst complex protein 7